MPPPALWFRARRGLRHASRINNVSGPRERSPSGLAHLGRRRDEPLFHTTIDGDRRKDAAASAFTRIDDQLAVRGNARAFIARAGRQHLHLARRVIERRDLKPATVAAHEHYALAVRQWTRRDVVGAVEREALDL